MKNTASVIYLKRVLRLRSGMQELFYPSDVVFIKENYVIIIVLYKYLFNLYYKNVCSTVLPYGLVNYVVD